MIKHLSLNWISLTEPDANLKDCQIRQWFPNLKGLKIGDGCNQNAVVLGERILSVFGDQIEAISLEQKMAIKAQKFPKLAELQIRRSDINLEPFLNVSSIRRAKIMDFSQEKIRSFIDLMIEKEAYCEHLFIKTNWKLIQFSMETIERKLFEPGNRKRKSGTLLIELVGNRWKDDLMETVNLQTFRLVHCIETTNVRNFRLSIKINPNRHESKQLNKDTQSIKQWMNELQSLQQKYLIHCDFIGDSFRVVISNKDCNICGYSHTYSL